jgi:hypothetical protein
MKTGKALYNNRLVEGIGVERLQYRRSTPIPPTTVITSNRDAQLSELL